MPGKEYSIMRKQERNIRNDKIIHNNIIHAYCLEIIIVDGWVDGTQLGPPTHPLTCFKPTPSAVLTKEEVY
jgi:hypothetical protein